MAAAEKAGSARLVAAEALRKVSEGGYSNIVLDAALKSADLDTRDRAFASALFYGVLERRITLDTIIARHSSQPPQKLSPEVLDALRMGVYQILYMDSVTDAAAVNESVELIKSLGMERASGFVNGVMRSFIRAGKKADFSSLTGAKRLSAEYAAPEWLCKKWMDEYGREAAERALAASLGAPPVFIRANTLRTGAAELSEKLAAEGVSVRAVEGFPNALRISGRAPQDTECYRRGLFHVQDISSQLASEALGVVSGGRVFDPCAAPGGKSFTMAELMDDSGEIVAGDVHIKRAELVTKGARRLGIKSVTAAENDAAVYNEKLGLFDHVLCDVPCSGLGVIRRKPEIRFKDRAQMAALPEIQFKIASTAARCLKSGGVLLYSTCTLSRAENDEVAKRLVRECGLVPAKLPERVAKYSADGYTATLLPGAYEGDGFYLARFIKK